MNVNLFIERLVLDGINVEPAQRPHLQVAIEAELGRLLAEGGIGVGRAGGGAVPSVTASGFQLAREDSPFQLGQRIARSVYGGIAK